MATLGANDIYRICRNVGFTSNQAATMTAIALAESAGRTDAHNGSGEDSWGLWQINVAAHPQYGGLDMTDPIVNAKAAFEVSGGGENITPWTTTHSKWGSAYKSHEHEALQAAAAYGDNGVIGNFTKPPFDYNGGAVPAALDGLAGSLNSALTSPAMGGAGNTSMLGSHTPVRVEQFVESALAQKGDAYLWGGKASPDNAHPSAFDCSGLVAWAAGRAGASVEGGADTQFYLLQKQGGEISVEQALHTRGALLFRGDLEHVAISLGDGTTIEARGKDYGVNSFSAEGRFQKAAIIPDLYDKGSVPAANILGGLPQQPTESRAQHDFLASLGFADSGSAATGLQQMTGNDPFSSQQNTTLGGSGNELFRSQGNPLQSDSNIGATLGTNHLLDVQSHVPNLQLSDGLNSGLGNGLNDNSSLLGQIDPHKDLTVNGTPDVLNSIFGSGAHDAGLPGTTDDLFGG